MSREPDSEKGLGEIVAAFLFPTGSPNASFPENGLESAKRLRETATPNLAVLPATFDMHVVYVILRAEAEPWSPIVAISPRHITDSVVLNAERILSTRYDRESALRRHLSGLEQITLWEDLRLQIVNDEGEEWRENPDTTLLARRDVDVVGSLLPPKGPRLELPHVGEVQLFWQNDGTVLPFYWRG